VPDQHNPHSPIDAQAVKAVKDVLPEGQRLHTPLIKPTAVRTDFVDAVNTP